MGYSYRPMFALIFCGRFGNLKPKAALAYCDLSAPQQSLPMGIDRQLCGYLIVKASTRHGLKPGL